MTVRFVDRDRGLARLKAQLRKRGATLHVGIPDGSTRREGGPTNAEIGMFHEFGTSHVPERSFIRATYDANRSQIRGAMRRIGSLSVRKGANHRALLEAYGQHLVGLIRARIRAGIPPALAESTKVRKGSSTPLIDTGQLVQSIKSWVLP